MARLRDGAGQLDIRACEGQFAGGQVVLRTFEEEVTGRDSLATIWGELKANQPGLTDAYLDQLQKVKDAGLMREYVWTNLRPPAWTVEPADLQLAHYGEWAKVNLVGHLVETHADARMGEAATK